MKNKFSLLMVLGVLMFTLGFPGGTASAAVADGTYDVPFEMKEAGSESASIADGYFSKPAKLVVENGAHYVDLTITNSEWVKSVSSSKGAEQVISENQANDTRTIRLQVGNLSQPETLKMHVVVPEDIAGMPYDNKHTVRAVFDVSGLESEQAAPPAQNNDGAEQSKDEGKQPVENPQTSDDAPIALYVTLLLGSVAVFAFYRLRVAKN